MIVNHLLSSKRLHPTRYILGLVYILLAALQPLIIKADLTGVKACQNTCFNKSECDLVGNGLCCQWDDDIDRCVSSIGRDLCLGTATMMPPPPWASIDCLLPEISLVESPSRHLSNTQTQSTPSNSPTIFDDGCMKKETTLDWYLCRGFTISHIRTQIITNKITAGLSILGSTYIIQDVLRDPQKQKESTYHRIMLGLSSSDIIFSFFSFFLGTWVMLRGEQMFAIGSNATCSVAGFFAAIGGVSTLLYSCSLATFYLLKLKYSWVNSKVKAIEKWLLFLPCMVGLIYAILPAAMSKLGPTGTVCM